MAKKKKQKHWYAQWWAIILIIILVFYFFQFINEQFLKTDNEKAKDYVKESLEGLNYENIIAGSSGDVAFVKAEHYKRPPSRHVSTILHRLNSAWKNATYYSIEVKTKGEQCSYFINGQDYRSWRFEGSLDGFMKWKEDINQSEDCY